MKYVDIFIESFGIYCYLILALRFLGKKEMSHLTIFDWIVFLLISELMTISIGNEEVGFFQGALSVFVIVMLDKLCSYLTLKFRSLKRLLEGHPSYIIYQGQLNQKKMKSLNYSIDDLCHHLREQGISSLSEVEFAILETDGHLSVIEKVKSNTALPDSLISNGKINDDLLNVMNKNRDWLIQELKKQGITDYHDIFYCIYENQKITYIKKEKG